MQFHLSWLTELHSFFYVFHSIPFVYFVCMVIMSKNIVGCRGCRLVGNFAAIFHKVHPPLWIARQDPKIETYTVDNPPWHPPLSSTTSFGIQSNPNCSLSEGCCLFSAFCFKILCHHLHLSLSFCIHRTKTATLCAIYSTFRCNMPLLNQPPLHLPRRISFSAPHTTIHSGRCSS